MSNMNQREYENLIADIRKSDETLKEELAKITLKQRKNRELESKYMDEFSEEHSPYQVGDKIRVIEYNLGGKEEKVVSVERIFVHIGKNYGVQFTYRCKKIKKNGEVSEHYYANRSTLEQDEIIGKVM